MTIKKRSANSSLKRIVADVADSVSSPPNCPANHYRSRPLPLVVIPCILVSISRKSSHHPFPLKDPICRDSTIVQSLSGLSLSLSLRCIWSIPDFHEHPILDLFAFDAPWPLLPVSISPLPRSISAPLHVHASRVDRPLPKHRTASGVARPPIRPICTNLHVSLDDLPLPT